MKKNACRKKRAPELFIGLTMIIVMATFLSPPKVTIKADGQGYYDYLPAIFIYKDFPNKGIAPTSTISERINNLGMYIDYKDYKIDKYPCGTAVLMSPFFAIAHATAYIIGASPDGYSAPYQYSVLVAAFIYFLLGLYFLRKLLGLYAFSKNNIITIQILAAFGSGLTHFTYFDPSFSHIYSFFVITTFFYFTKSYIHKRSNKSFMLASLFLGLTILVRQVNGIVILFVPFLAGSFSELKDIFCFTFKKPILFLKALTILLLILFVQAVLWYVETGTFFVYSYQGEGFNLLHPVIYKVLFSYKKGLFVYTPLLFLSFLCLIYWITQKKFYLVFTWLGFFFIVTYIISSWWCWYYGCSFGHRAFVDFYSIFFIPLAYILRFLNKKLRIVFIALCLLAIPLNLIQSKQYRNYILQWQSMDKMKYWKVFLRLDNRYKGILWKKHYFFNNSTTAYLDSFEIKTRNIEQESSSSVLNLPTSSFHSFKDANVLQLQFYNKFSPSDKTKIITSIDDTLKNKRIYYHEVPVIHFADDKLNKYQLGIYNFEFSPIVSDSGQFKLNIQVETQKDSFKMDDIKIKAISYK